MLKIIVYLGIFQFVIIGMISIIKKTYLKVNFKEYSEEELFETYQRKNLTIKEYKSNLSKLVYLPVLGIFKIPALIVRTLDEIASYHKVEHIWDNVIREHTFEKITEEYNRLGIKHDSIELAKELVNMNLHTEVIMASTELLLSTIKLIVIDDDNTKTALDETINEYHNVLMQIKNSPNVVDIKTLSNTKEIFSSIKSDVAGSRALF